MVNKVSRHYHEETEEDKLRKIKYGYKSTVMGAN